MGFHDRYATQVEDLLAAFKPGHGVHAEMARRARPESIYGFNRSICALFWSYYWNNHIAGTAVPATLERQTTIRIKTVR
jgi:hypothetical protein